MNRKVHYWGALVCAVPVLIIIATGIMLLLKKESSWIQPPTVKVENKGVAIGLEQVLEAATTAKGAEINGWNDIDRMDVRPGKGIVKVQSKSRWEVQVDLSSGEVLQVAYRRSDWIESIHDGTFFHDHAKLLVWLPSSIILLILWVTGIYLFALPLWKKNIRKKKTKGLKGGRLIAFVPNWKRTSTLIKHNENKNNEKTNGCHALDELASYCKRRGKLMDVLQGNGHPSQGKYRNQAQ